MPPPPIPPVDPEKHKDRLITWRAAILTAIAGLAAGFVGAVAGLGGALITANAQSETARTQFTLTQRQAAYAQFFNDATRARENEVNIYTGFGDRFLTIDEERVFEADLQTLTADYGLLQLVASEQADSAARAVLDAVEAGYMSLLWEACWFGDINLDNCSLVIGQEDQPSYDRNRYDTALETYREAARMDLNQED